MKSLILITGLLLLNACSVSISDEHIIKAKELCAANEGIKHINGNNLFGMQPIDISVNCKNGAYFYIGKIK